jgi:hypothetical protein
MATAASAALGLPDQARVTDLHLERPAGTRPWRTPVAVASAPPPDIATGPDGGNTAAPAVAAASSPGGQQSGTLDVGPSAGVSTGDGSDATSSSTILERARLLHAAAQVTAAPTAPSESDPARAAAPAGAASIAQGDDRLGTLAKGRASAPNRVLADSRAPRQKADRRTAGDDAGSRSPSTLATAPATTGTGGEGGGLASDRSGAAALAASGAGAPGGPRRVADAAAPDAAPNKAQADPGSATVPTPTDRITIKLGDEAGAASLRVSIRGDRIDARIITSDPALASSLQQGRAELSSALEAQGFHEARVQVRGTPSALEGSDLANLAGSAARTTRDAGTQQGDGESRSSGRHPSEQRSQQAFEDRQRQQQGRPRRWLLDEEER